LKRASFPVADSAAPETHTPEEPPAEATEAAATDAAGTATGSDGVGTEDMNIRWTSLPSASSRTNKAAKEKTPVKPKAAKSKNAKSKTASASEPATTKKLSALDAADKVLQETGRPMNCQELIADMAAKGYWTSPAGKTPSATLYAAMTREIKIKGEQARFQKSARGRFAYRAPAVP
jgi:hypothetical protein